jgi:endoglucanase
MNDHLHEIIRSVLAQPTAPFHEDAVRAEIFQQLAQCLHVRTKQDAFGNVIAHYQRGPESARFALVAHMDHPGYVGGEFLGSVPEEYRKSQPPTRDFGAFAMWDLPACELREGRVYSRACDDLIGCAAILATFQELERAGAEASVYGLFTRAEEVGFVGAIRLAQAGLVPAEVTIVSLETSSEKAPGCKMGEGVIVRVGDRTSIFDPAVTATFLDLAKRTEIPVQRCLMSGGTCEATAFQLYGYRCGALCVALGNYHNCGPDQRIEPEFVALTDVQALVRLCTEIARSTEPLAAADEALRARLEKRATEYAERFA